jgi:hypothetical protein
LPRKKDIDLVNDGIKDMHKMMDVAAKEVEKITLKEMTALLLTIRKTGIKNPKLWEGRLNRVFAKMERLIGKDVFSFDEEDLVVLVTKQLVKNLKRMGYKVKREQINAILKKVKERPFSKALHSSNIKTKARFLRTLSTGLQEGTNAIKLAKKLKNVGDLIAADITIPRHIQDIERALRRAASSNLTTAKAGRIEVEKMLRKHKRYIDNLTRAGADGFQQLGIGRATRKFRRQALSMLNDTEELTKENLEKLVNDWRESKVVYRQTNVARTEINERFHQLHMLFAIAVNGIIGEDVRLSPQHPKVDICDDLAGTYLFEEHGSDIPVPPHHPNCICTMHHIFAEEFGQLFAEEFGEAA